MAIARWLRARPEVREVLYPALPGARGHELWKRDFSGASSLFGVVLQPVAEARIAAMLDGLELFGMGWSWGGFESLVIPTWPERSRSATPWEPGGPCLRLRDRSRGSGRPDRRPRELGFERLVRLERGRGGSPR